MSEEPSGTALGKEQVTEERGKEAGVKLVKKGTRVSFRGERRFFCGIKKANHQIPPAHNVSLGGTVFREQSQTLVRQSSGAYNYAELSAPQPGEYQDFDEEQYNNVLEALEGRGVRWFSGKNRDDEQVQEKRAEVMSFRDRPGLMRRRRPNPGDEPLADYIVLIDVETGSVPHAMSHELEDFPVISEMFPHLRDLRIKSGSR